MASNNDTPSQSAKALMWFLKKLNSGEEIRMPEFSNDFGYIHEQDAHAAFLYPLNSTEIPRSVRTKLNKEYETWRRNEGSAYWASRETSYKIDVSTQKTAGNLVDRSELMAEILLRKPPQVEPKASSPASVIPPSSSSSSSSTSTPISPSSASTSTPAISPSPLSSTSSPTKKKRAQYCTEEPWRSLMISLIKIVNGQSNVSFPEAPVDMKYIHGQLFRHAVSLLEEYQAQCPADKDTTLIKDAQVVMSCLLNTMSPRVIDHFTDVDDQELISNAVFHTTIPGFEAHECLEFIKGYAPVVKEHDVPHLRRKLVVDWAALLGRYPHGELPRSGIIQDKVFKILIHLCDFIENPPFGSGSPSENDCLQLWSYVFGTIVDKVTIHSGERILDASKTLRQQQASEFGDVSETGRKVDLIFKYKEIELSNVEFKRTDISSTDIAVQCRKNVRLGRCLQEVHAAYGFKDASVIMGDVAGFVGLFYQVRPLREVSVAGKTSASMVYLPTTSGALESFLESTSLAMIWKFVEFLEDQGPKIARAKERHQIDLETKKFAQAIGFSRSSTPPPTVKKYDHNVTFSPTKKRLYSATVD